MDINGTRFHLLTGADDWEPLLMQTPEVALWWDTEAGGVALLPEILRYGVNPAEQPLSRERRRGADCDRFGNFFWLDEHATRIRILPAGTTEAGDWWRLADWESGCTAAETGDFQPLAVREPSPPRLRGLAVTREHYLVVGTLDPGGLLIFDLHGGGPPEWLRWPADRPFAPEDLAAAADGGIWVLSRVGSGVDLWALDRLFRATGPTPTVMQEPADFTPHGSAPAPASSVAGFPTGLPLLTGAPDPLQEAISVVGLPDGSALILGMDGAGESVLVRIRDWHESNRVVLSGGILDRVLEDPAIAAHDFAFVPTGAAEAPDEVRGELAVVLGDGNQALLFGLEAFHEQLELTLRPRYLPLRRFSGKALVGGADGAYYDLEERWYRVTEQPRRRAAAAAVLAGLVFDGRDPGCVWHRLLLDASIPSHTALRVESRAADDRELLAGLPWAAEPVPVRRSGGSEIDGFAPYGEAAPDCAGTWELLLQEARGRFLELRLSWTGDGRATPRLRALRAYYPRYSYLEHHLPAVYREETHSAGFLDRYLANAEGILSHLEDRIARAEARFDSRTADGEFLPWLAGWLGVVFDDHWGASRRRLLLDHAELLYRWRGTLDGMLAMVRLAVDPCPDAAIFAPLRGLPDSTPRFAGRDVRIVERFRLRNQPGVLVGDPTTAGLAQQLLTGGDLGDAQQLSRRFRVFLQRRYGEADLLARINTAWGSTYGALDEIQFPAEPPPPGARRSDWMAFLQRELALTGSWQPAQGVFALHVRFQEYLRSRYAEFGDQAVARFNAHWDSSVNAFEAVRFPPLRPNAEAAATDWELFIRDRLGFTYAPVAAADTERYRDFLRRRYRRIERLNERYGVTSGAGWSGFDAVTLPAELPVGGAALQDWIAFVSLLLPIRRNAHRFSVLVPTEPGELPESRAQRMARVDRVVQREKPAHTDHEVKLFWALFQVGSARLGQDTQIGDSARFVAIVLGGTYLGQGLLGHSQPWNAMQRRVLGRDRLPRSLQGDLGHE